MVEADLVVDVVLVEERRLGHGQIAGRRPLDPLLQDPQPGLGEDCLVDPDPLAERRELPLTLERLEPVEDRTQLRVCCDLLLLGDDGEPEVDGRRPDTPGRMPPWPYGWRNSSGIRDGA